MDNLSATRRRCAAHGLGHHGGSPLHDPDLVAVGLLRDRDRRSRSGSPICAGVPESVLFRAWATSPLLTPDSHSFFAALVLSLLYDPCAPERRPETAIPGRGLGGDSQPQHLPSGGSAAWSSPATRGGSRPFLTADASDHTTTPWGAGVRFFSPVWPGRLSSPSSLAVRQGWAALSSLAAVPPRPPIPAGRSSLLPAPLRLRLGLQVHLYWLATSALRLTAGEMRPCGPVSGS